MAVVLVGDVIQVTINGSLSNQRTMSIFQYGVESVTGSPQDDVLAAAFQSRFCAANNVMDKYRACVPSNWVAGPLWWQIIKPTRIQKRVLSSSSPGAQSDYVAATPNIAGVITRRGDIAQRKRVSTLHVPSPTSQDWVESGIFSIEALTAYTALAAQIVTPITTTGTVAQFYPIIFNGPTAADVTPITTAFISDNSRVMRRRTVRFGI